MNNWRIADIVAYTRGTLVQGSPQQSVGGVSIDSRTVQNGALFVALRGERFDGHWFVPEAVQKGAVAVLVSEAQAIPSGLRTQDGQVPAVVVVPDTLQALQAFAHAHRRHYAGTVIAVTGSSGKTTVKEMMAAVLQTRFATFKAPGNLNNHIGVPLAVLQLPLSTTVAVFELGMNHLGEIRHLCRIVQPRVGVITNIGLAHVGYLGSIERIQQAKGELIDALDASAVAVVNADDPRALALGKRVRGRLITFGQGAGAEVRGYIRQEQGCAGLWCVLELRGSRWELHLSTPGSHNLLNALAAAAVGVALEVPSPCIVAGLQNYRGMHGRLMVHQTPDGMVVVDDTYNANPQSMRAALTFLQQVPGEGRRIAVLGDMLELGEAGPTLHEEIGMIAARSGLAYLITLGSLAQLIAQGAIKAGMPAARIYSALDQHDVLALLSHLARPQDIILFKGSRGMAMERLVQALCARGGEH